jgi:hypothetical protein
MMGRIWWYDDYNLMNLRIFNDQEAVRGKVGNDDWTEVSDFVFPFRSEV